MSSKRCLRRASPTSPLAWNRSTCRGQGLQTNQQCMFGRHFFALQGPHEIIKETVSVHCGAVGLRWPDKSCSNLLCASHPSCANATHSQTRLATGHLGGGRRAWTRPSPHTQWENARGTITGRRGGWTELHRKNGHPTGGCAHTVMLRCPPKHQPETTETGIKTGVSTLLFSV